MKEEENMKIKIDTQTVLRRAAFLFADIASVILTVLGAVLVCVNFEFVQDGFQYYWSNAVSTVVVDIILTVVIFLILHLYSSVWSYASVTELAAIVVGCFLSTATVFVIDVIFDKIC